jgi:hypothetical protein
MIYGIPKVIIDHLNETYRVDVMDQLCLGFYSVRYRDAGWPKPVFEHFEPVYVTNGTMLDGMRALVLDARPLLYGFGEKITKYECAVEGRGDGFAFHEWELSRIADLGWIDDESQA